MVSRGKRGRKWVCVRVCQLIFLIFFFFFFHWRKKKKKKTDFEIFFFSTNKANESPPWRSEVGEKDFCGALFDKTKEADSRQTLRQMYSSISPMETFCLSSVTLPVVFGNISQGSAEF